MPTGAQTQYAVFCSLLQLCCVDRNRDCRLTSLSLEGGDLMRALHVEKAGYTIHRFCMALSCHSLVSGGRCCKLLQFSDH